MVLYNRYKYKQQRAPKKRKSLDNPVVNQASELEFHRPNLDYLLHFKKEMDAMQARTMNMAMKRRLLEGQMKANYETEMARLKGEMHNPRIPETSLEHLQKRYDKLSTLSESIF